MKFKELAELFMLPLYEHGEKEGYDMYLDLVPVAASLGINDWAKVANVAKFLEHEGLVHEVLLTSGQTSARLTGEGQLSVEEGGDTGIIDRFKENPAEFLVNVDQSAHFHGDVTSSAVAVHSSVGSQRLDTPVENLLEELLSEIDSDPKLSDEERRELSSDIVLLRSELSRREPRRQIVQRVLSSLGDIASLSSLATQLGALLS